MSWTPLAQRIHQLPLILAGPIVRRVEPHTVTIWLALKESRAVELSVYTRAEDNQLHEECRGSQRTIRVGDNLHMVAVTARVEHEAAALQWGQLYYYNLTFSSKQAGQQTTLASPGVLTTDPNETEPIQRIVYPGHPLPGFLLPAQHIHDLRIIHGSCRKTHGLGKEILSSVDTLIARAEENGGTGRPQQLYMTGDQIYADDVATPLLHALTDAGNTLLAGNQREILPTLNLPADKLLPGTRRSVIANQTKFTSSKTDNHLISFAEYITMYLFNWSDTLWPEELLSVEDFWAWLYPGVHAESVTQTKEQRHYREELEQLNSFRSALPQVRRALANIATYMICDDHDITDDWFLDGAWCHNVLKKPLGRRIIRNGLLAYALCQAWGNTPEQFTKPHGKALLEALDSWHGDEQAAQTTTIIKALGVPESFSGKGSLPHPPQALTWNYSYEGPNYQIIVMDTRTHRYYRNPKDFPGLLSSEAMKSQIDNIEREEAEVTLIISAAPVIGIDFVESVQFWSRWRVKENYRFDREAWALDWGTFQQFLRTLSDLKRVVFLSGDVHYAFGSSLEYWDVKTKQSAKFINFTSSPYCNEGSGSQISVLAIGYPSLRSLLQRGKEPKLDFFAWDITKGDHHTLNYLLKTIRKQLFRFWWAIPRLIAAHRSSSEIVMPAAGWVKGTFDNIPPSRSYRIRYLTNTRNQDVENEHSPHTHLTRFSLRPLRGALQSINILQILTRRLGGKLRARNKDIADSTTTFGRNTRENILDEAIEQTDKINQKLEQPKTGIVNTVMNYDQWLSRWKAGNLIVGYNNLGEINFCWDQEKKEVTQRLWWHNPDESDQLLSTEYTDTLELPRAEDEPSLP
ncbi:hypothetical protein KDW_19770 [Dictyobacter vulcani]|uniref:PhoD-like phosphatase metallophosphatase domain-containing protein n=1 Tax=Dictyobacter vulcani TaxID=2607529 RepID=A0A5J4KJ38_9CHLR|nr:hypothetical protein [Dictyobacter vulcani]GER87815.1 hypothetical protein KDW_19770 [Dictyobacter vulcani]